MDKTFEDTFISAMARRGVVFKRSDRFGGCWVVGLEYWHESEYEYSIDLDYAIRYALSLKPSRIGRLLTLFRTPDYNRNINPMPDPSHK